MVVRCGVLAVDGHQKLIPMHPAAPIEHEVREQKPPLRARQPPLQALPVHLRDEPSAEMDLHGAPSPIASKLRKLDETFPQGAAASLALDNREEQR